LALESDFDLFNNLVVMNLTGTSNAVEIADEYQKIFDDERFVEGMHAIWNCSEIDLKRIPISEVRRLPVLLRQFMERRGTDYKAAIVTSRGADFQLLRIYLTILKLIGNIQFKVFRTLEEANLWINGAD
jgi:hypothetical protein